MKYFFPAISDEGGAEDAWLGTRFMLWEHGYGNLVRSQLTSDELKLLAFNGLSPVSKDLDKLIAEFRMLKYLPQSSVRNKLKNIYPKEAFSARD